MDKIGTSAYIAGRKPPSSDKLRLWIVRLVFLFFWLLPVEGVLRKWIVPEIQGPLIFLRDPVAVAVTVLYLIRRDWRLPVWFILWFSVLTLLTMLAAVQVVFRDISPLVIFIGLRNYLLFVPIMFVMAEVLEDEDLRRFLVQACVISVPVAVLVVVQFYSPVASVVNKGLSDDVVGRFTVVAGIVRPYGPFTFIVGQAVFGGLMVALTVICFERRRAWHLGLLVPLSCGGATIVMGALSGARTFFITALLVIAIYVLGNFTARRIASGIVKIVGSIVAVVTFVLVFTLLFPRAYSAMSERQTVATEAEGATSLRALSMLSPVPASGVGLSLVGEGLGVGSNAGGFAQSGNREFRLSEYETPRVFQEAGIIGGAVIMLGRIATALWIIGRCIQAGRTRSETSSFALLGFCLSLLLGGQISGQNQAISFCWFSLGLCAAFARGTKTQGRLVLLLPNMSGLRKN